MLKPGIIVMWCLLGTELNFLFELEELLQIPGRSLILSNCMPIDAVWTAMKSEDKGLFN